MDFESFFTRGLDEGSKPLPYQRRLAEGPWPETLIVPTGFGKTAAVLAAWVWKIAHADEQTPRRLVYCLPMRTLVEQTETAVTRWMSAGKTVFDIDIQMDVLMGGRVNTRRGVPDWVLGPDRPTILIGTQDLLVSAALMRGYATSRFRWPVDFALLHNGSLWVFDEVQLTGAALPTSAQLEGLRRAFTTGRPSRTLWMSATLDPDWLRTVDFQPSDLGRPHDLSPDDLAAARHLWTARKTLDRLDTPAKELNKKSNLDAYARAVADTALSLRRTGATAIVFVNTVSRAQAIYDALSDRTAEPERLLIHSRFRKLDRDRLIERLRAPAPAAGRIIVSTQALEAGVDISSAILITELAPWSSLIQRVGRCNRYGECGIDGAGVWWIDLDDGDAKPYEPQDFAEARSKLSNLAACGPADLAPIPPSRPPTRHVIRRRDLLDLFDTDPDLTGFDLDISLYVRDADDTDVSLFWRPIAGSGERKTEKAPLADAPAPARDELCPAPIGGAKDLLKRKGAHAWRWDALTKRWLPVRDGDLFPGMVIWVDAASGGYDADRGFDPAIKAEVAAVVRTMDGEAMNPQSESAMQDDTDTYSNKLRVSLARHSAHVRDEAEGLCKVFGLSTVERDIVVEAALWHDLGKAHPAFVALTAPALSNDCPGPLAKWPKSSGSTNGKLPEQRRYFRHELASALAYLANRNWAEAANLPAYLIAAHHGKVRLRLRALPKEAGSLDKPDQLFARGVWDGDALPETRLDGMVVPSTRLDLDIMQLGDGKCGASWSARTRQLLAEHGPFRLAWLEALVRIADWRASEAEEKAGIDDL